MNVSPTASNMNSKAVDVSGSAAKMLSTSDFPQSTRSISLKTTSPAESFVPISTTNIPNDSSQTFTSVTSNGKGKLLWGVIGAVCGLSVVIGLALAYKMLRRRNRHNLAPSDEYKHSYAYVVPTASWDNTLLSTSEGTGERQKLHSITTTASSSLLSLPNFLHEPPEPSVYSPAVESSDLFHSQGHSPLSERPISLSNFVRLVPQRRPGGRWQL
ncbi:hypothetical protein C8R43DRAFT_1034937 [Mycena crocata]|nr:hypothetical protein C8R43DRAFT_1034937 [Mycena crocata]